MVEVGMWLLEAHSRGNTSIAVIDLDLLTHS